MPNFSDKQIKNQKRQTTSKQTEKCGTGIKAQGWSCALVLSTVLLFTQVYKLNEISALKLASKNTYFIEWLHEEGPLEIIYLDRLELRGDYNLFFFTFYKVIHTHFKELNTEEKREK